MENINEIQQRYGTATEEESAEEAKNRLSGAAEQAKLKTQEFWEDAADLIREHPGKAIGIALLTGIAVGALIGSQAESDSKEPTLPAAQATWDEAKANLSTTLAGLRQFIDQAINKLQP